MYSSVKSLKQNLLASTSSMLFLDATSSEDDERRDSSIYKGGGVDLDELGREIASSVLRMLQRFYYECLMVCLGAPANIQSLTGITALVIASTVLPTLPVILFMAPTG